MPVWTRVSFSTQGIAHPVTGQPAMDMEDVELEKILAHYNQGPRVVAPGDEEELTLYRCVDHVGLLHEEELPPLNAQEKKENLRTARRADKWLKMIRNWRRYKQSSKMKRRIYKGIPPQVRGRVWALLLGLDKIMLQNKGEYEYLKKLGIIHSPYIREIDREVSRTFRGHIMYQQRYGTMQQALFHILVTYSIYNPEVGHSQHITQLVALLLLYLSEEEAFWALNELMTADKYLMNGFFIPGRPKLGRFLAHHDRVLKKNLPRLKQHLDQEELPSRAYASQWFLECFLHRTPFSLTLRIVDIFLLDGERVLSGMAYALLALHKKRLLKLPREGMLEYLGCTLSDSWDMDDDIVIKKLQASMSRLKRQDLDLPPPAVPDGCLTVPPQQPPCAQPRTKSLQRSPQAWGSEPTLPVTNEGAERSPHPVPSFRKFNATYSCSPERLAAPPKPCHPAAAHQAHTPQHDGQQAAGCKTPLVPCVSNIPTPKVLRYPSEGCLSTGHPCLPPRASTV